TPQVAWPQMLVPQGAVHGVDWRIPLHYRLTYLRYGHRTLALAAPLPVRLVRLAQEPRRQLGIGRESTRPSDQSIEPQPSRRWLPEVVRETQPPDQTDRSSASRRRRRARQQLLRADRTSMDAQPGKEHCRSRRRLIAP